MCIRAPRGAKVSIFGDLSPTWESGKTIKCPQMMFSNIYNKSRCYSLKQSPPDLSNAVTNRVALTNLFIFSSLHFSWAGDKLQMSTSRHLRKYQGLSPSMQKRCPLVLCCCKSLDCISLRQIVSDPRCENLPDLQQKLVWRRIHLRACPVVKTNGFNQGWYDFFYFASDWHHGKNKIASVDYLSFFYYYWMRDMHL